MATCKIYKDLGNKHIQDCFCEWEMATVNLKQWFEISAQFYLVY